MSQSTPVTQDAASQSSEAVALVDPNGSIVLVTSDNQKVPVDRLLLAANSSVFRDMFASSAEDQQEPCTITESREDVLLFVKALKGQPPKDEATWLSLYRMMDKYDAPIIRLALLIFSREKLGSDPLLAYCAGALLADKYLQKDAAKSCSGISLSSETRPMCTLPELEKLRLRGYQLARFQVAWLQTANAAQFSSSGVGLCRCTEPLRGTHNLYSSNIYYESFSHILRKAQQDAEPVRGNGDMFSPSHPFHSSVCQHCKNQIENKWRNLEVNWTAELEKIDLFRF